MAIAIIAVVAVLVLGIGWYSLNHSSAPSVSSGGIQPHASKAGMTRRGARED
jgi:hypothetical protein